MYTQKSDYVMRFTNATHTTERFTIEDGDIAGDILPHRDYKGALKIKDLLYLRQMSFAFTGTYQTVATGETTAKQVGKRLLYPYSGNFCFFDTYRNEGLNHDNPYSGENHSNAYKVTILANGTTIHPGLFENEIPGSSTDGWFWQAGLDYGVVNFNLPSYDEATTGGFDPLKFKRVYDAFFNKRYLLVLGNGRLWTHDSVIPENHQLDYKNTKMVASGVRKNTQFQTGGGYILVDEPSSWTKTSGLSGRFLGFRNYIDGGYRIAGQIYDVTDYTVNNGTSDHPDLKKKLYLKDITNTGTMEFQIPVGCTRCYGIFRMNVNGRLSLGGTAKSKEYYAVIKGEVGGNKVTFNVLSYVAQIKKDFGWSDSLIGAEYDNNASGVPYFTIGETLLCDMICDPWLTFQPAP